MVDKHPCYTILTILMWIVWFTADSLRKWNLMVRTGHLRSYLRLREQYKDPVFSPDRDKGDDKKIAYHDGDDESVWFQARRYIGVQTKFSSHVAARLIVQLPIHICSRRESSWSGGVHCGFNFLRKQRFYGGSHHESRQRLHADLLLLYPGWFSFRRFLGEGENIPSGKFLNECIQITPRQIVKVPCDKGFLVSRRLSSSVVLCSFHWVPNSGGGNSPFQWSVPPWQSRRKNPFRGCRVALDDGDAVWWCNAGDGSERIPCL